MRLKVALGLALLGLLAACNRADEGSAANGGNETITVPDDEANVAEAPNEMAEPTPTKARLDELAGIRVGRTVAQLRAAGINAITDPGPDPDSSCGYARVPGLKDIFIMLDGKTVVRVDVATPGHASLGGVEVGMSEDEALRRLGPGAKVEPHPYTGPEGHYLVVHAAKSPLGFIAETDGRKVVSYRIGRWEQVQWIEGCS